MPEWSEIVEEDGIKYQIDHYEGGGTVKYQWVDPDAPPPPEPPEWTHDLISDEAQAMLEMQENIQYLVDLAEINNEEEE